MPCRSTICLLQDAVVAAASITGSLLVVITRNGLSAAKGTIPFVGAIKILFNSLVSHVEAVSSSDEHLLEAKKRAYVINDQVSTHQIYELPRINVFFF